MEFDPLPQQSLAIEAPLGPLLVVAGPGAGKTFCLIARINHLITTVGIAPERICAVTFTNRAAEEIAVRLKPALRDRAAAGTRGAIPARWDYLLVDEFQDVNPVQYDLLKRLAAPHGNFFAVGDDEQSIFTWTGADPYVLVRFARDYGIDRPVVLDKNCRCSRQIFETARRVLAQNPQLFEKQLTAEQDSPHEVGAFGFRDEEEEASWLLEDLQGDRGASELGWGDYAILYRKHKIGEYLEGRLLRAGIPCRLARGRSLIEDDVIKYVISALRIVRDPADPVALEGFARCVLSPHFLQEVEAAISTQGSGDFLASVRALARRRPAQDPDTKKLWRLVYQVENLRALTRSHRALAPLVDEILSQSVGPYRNALEERHDELTDPADLPDAVRLAARLARAIAGERGIAIAPQDGLEIALRGMLAAAGVRHVPSAGSGPLEPRGTAPGLAHPGEVLGKADGGEHGLALTLFKALQLLDSRGLDTALERYVTFDFETTDTEVATCGVVEIGAARVVRGEIVDRFRSLVQPYRPITPGASAIHGYSDGDIRDARSFGEVWPEFRAFIGDDILIAHNGQHFDIPVLRRLAAGRDGVDSLVFYDTLPLVPSLSRDSGKLEDLALRFGIDGGRAHHALDDAVTLARVYRELERRRGIRAG